MSARSADLPLDEVALDSLRPMLSSLGDMSGVQTRLVDDVFAQARAAIALRDRVAELEARELRAENELAAVLPEDVGPVEYIRALRDRCERQERLLAVLRPVVRAGVAWLAAPDAEFEPTREDRTLIYAIGALPPQAREWALADEPQGGSDNGGV